MFEVLAASYWIFLNAVWGRVDGGGIAKVSEWAERSLILFAFVLACSMFAGVYSLFAIFGAVGIATGHGQYFLDRKAKRIEPEKVDFIVRLFFGADPRTKKQKSYYQAMQKYGMTKLYWRNAAGMFTTGLLLGLPSALLALYFNQYLIAFLFTLTAPAKALAYIIGNYFWNSTEPAEWINGAFRGAITAFIIWMFYA